MVATTVNVSVQELAPMGGTSQSGIKAGYIIAGAKAAQNDKWALMNVKEVILAFPTVDATGASGLYTIDGNEITLTSTTTGAHSALVIYR